MEDHLLRATVPGVRAFAAVTTNLTEEARRRHNSYPVATAALGRTMTGALLLAANLKTSESLTIRIKGDGPLGEVIADARANGTVRGYVRNSQVELSLNQLGKLDVGGAIGQGHLYLTRFTNLKQPFTGSSELVSGEIAEDLTQYLYVSEQTPSSVALGVKVNPNLTVLAAGGFIIQALPNADDEVLAQIEQNLKTLPSVSTMVEAGATSRSMLERVFETLPIQWYEHQGLSFECTCSRDKVSAMLISLGNDEISELESKGQAEIICHFCNEHYYFEPEELRKFRKGPEGS